jgi:hypothetical protein
MGTEIAGSTGIALAIAVAIHDVVLHRGGGPTGHPGAVTVEQLDVTREDDLDSAIDPAVALRELFGSFGGNLSHGRTPGCTIGGTGGEGHTITPLEIAKRISPVSKVTMTGSVILRRSRSSITSSSRRQRLNPPSS